jgi:F0F1-type ATP synthase assembly protein I
VTSDFSAVTWNQYLINGLLNAVLVNVGSAKRGRSAVEGSVVIWIAACLFIFSNPFLDNFRFADDPLRISFLLLRSCFETGDVSPLT